MLLSVASSAGRLHTVVGPRDGWY